MEQEEILSTKKNSKWIYILLTQLVCVFLILAGIITSKLFFKPTYAQLKEFFTEYICDETDINEILLED